MLKIVLLIVTGLSSSLCAESKFGYISFSQNNLGDHIQTIAAKRFLPKNSISIDREQLAEFRSNDTINTIVNGWFLLLQNDSVSWPPSPEINPLFISMHITQPRLPEIFTEENIAYLKKHGPIGARDHLCR